MSDDVGKAIDLVERGALYEHPGPVLLVGSDRSVLARNLNGAGAAIDLRDDNLPSLAIVIDAVLAGTGPQTVKIGNDDSGATIDFAVLPVAGGAAALALGRDVSLDHNLRAALIDSRQRYKDLVEISADFVWETGDRGQFVFVSASGALGYDSDELVGFSAAQFLVSGGGADDFGPFATREPLHGAEVRVRRADGGVAVLEAAAAPLYDEDGVWRGARGVCRDVTEARRQEAELAKARNRERLTAYIMRAIRDELDPDRMLGVAAETVLRVLDADGVTLYRIVQGAGLVPANAAGTPIDDDLFETVHESVTDTRGPATAETRDGYLLAHQLSYHRTMNGAVVLWRSTERGGWLKEDEMLIAELSSHLGIAMQQAEAHQHLRMLSSTDAMTGLLNRRSFEESLAFRLSENTDARSGVLTYVDLDNFKQVNDIRGHQTGDAALIHLARILNDQAGPDDLVARLGGDEFAMWLEDVGTDRAAARAEAILVAGEELKQYSGSEERPVGLSIGLAVFEPRSGETLEQLVGRADSVMYEIKRGGKGWYRIAKSRADVRSGSGGRNG